MLINKSRIFTKMSCLFGEAHWDSQVYLVCIIPNKNTIINHKRQKLDLQKHIKMTNPCAAIILQPFCTVAVSTKTSSMTTRQLAFPLSCCKSCPRPATKCLSGEHYPTEAEVLSMRETCVVPLQPESFLLSILLAQKFRNTAQECLPRESRGRQAGLFSKGWMLRPAILCSPE